VTIVLDTDVASAVLRRRTPTPLAAHLAGHVLAFTFVTVGELINGRSSAAGVPTATKDFADFADHEGLHLIPTS
jgi:predicted nucleic acid-binding protein